ncbi:MAG: 3-deoxy-D-manno-octulosonic acid transferase [Bacteroidales bacterium]|jgi:3-deoxy-D-manno-octulosonic-acid transferase|nr:3-deoxy-D-manno-octulosonic acid transferase [Bacteroidales bacterium]
MNTLYNIVVYVATFAVSVAARFNSKAGLWHTGIHGWKHRYAAKVGAGKKTVWIHCASLGEFEQGRPVIESLKAQYPEYAVALTFFSPSGFEVRKNYAGADYVFYLPPDTPGNARRLIDMLNPAFVVFVKYEFWNNYISELHRRAIPLYLISAIFRPGQHFFKWYGAFFRNILKKFTMFFVQDMASLELLASAGIRNAIVAGDTRFDRVAQIASEAKEIKTIEQFRGSEKLFLAGSSWRNDEEIIARYINTSPARMKWVFAPHEPTPENVARLERLLDVKCVRYSRYTEPDSDARVLIIDGVGILSSAYRYAHIAAIGGGFGKGIHNILEAACWGLPVMFGPEYGRFREAVELIDRNGAASFNSFETFSAVTDRWLSDNHLYTQVSQASQQYVADNRGATDTILNTVFAKTY